MKNSLKIFLLLLTYVLVAVCTFGIVTWMYQIPVPQLDNLDYQLYIGIAAGVLGLILGFIAAFARGKKQKAEKTAVVEEVKEEPVEKTAPVEEAVQQEPAETVMEEITEEPAEEVHPEEVPAEEEPVSETIEVIEEPAVEEPVTEEPAEEITVEAPVIDAEPEEELRIEPDEITQAFTPIVEEPTESLNAEVPPVVIVSPLGPRNIRKTEFIEEQVDDEELEEALKEAEEPTLFDMIDEVSETLERVDLPAEEVNEEPAEESHEEYNVPVYDERPQLEPELSDTQESFINDSRVSYMNDEGKPQFVITQNIEKITEIPEEEKKANFEGYDVRAEKMARISSFINKVLTIILIAALLFGIYWLYQKYFG